MVLDSFAPRGDETDLTTFFFIHDSEPYNEEQMNSADVEGFESIWEHFVYGKKSQASDQSIFKNEKMKGNRAYQKCY